VALLDLNTLELTKDSFIDQRLREYYSDLLYRVQLKNGTSAFVYLLLEHKRQAKRLTVVQVLRYIVEIWESPLAQIEGKTVLPPVIPIVVYHGDQPWPYGQSLHAILSLPAELAPYVPEFRYELCDLAGLADADIKGAVLLRVALLVMKHIADPRLAEQLPEIFGLLRTLAEKPTALGYLETLLRYLAAAATRLTEPDIQQALAEILPALEEKLMPTIAETWLERGRTEGRAEGRVEGRTEGRVEGRAEGRVEGRTEGRLEAERYILIRLLERRFGPLPTPYQARIAAADSETLLHWSEQVLSAQRLQDVFEVLQ